MTGPQATDSTSSSLQFRVCSNDNCCQTAAAAHPGSTDAPGASLELTGPGLGDCQGFPAYKEDVVGALFNLVVADLHCIIIDLVGS